MIITKCPLRVSMVGGSTDLQEYLDEYRYGSVISFPINLYTYIILKKINNGFEHNIVYSNIKETPHCKDPSSIKNDIVRAVFSHFQVPPVEIIFTADIPSGGSGLASSSSYLIGLIRSVDELLGTNLSQYEICNLAIKLERQFNPLAGYQDVYGCGIGGLKQMEFSKHGLEYISFLDSSAFKKMNMYLYPTNQLRSSTSVLSTLNFAKVNELKKYVNELKNNIGDMYSIFNIINDSWDKKKETSSEILNPTINSIELMLRKNGSNALKLLGAGGGGYFLSLHDKKNFDDKFIEISINTTGVISNKV